MKLPRGTLLFILVPVAVAVFLVVRCHVDNRRALAGLRSGATAKRIAAFKHVELKRLAGVEDAAALASDPDPMTRRMGILLLARVRDREKALAQLTPLLKSADIETRHLAIFALGELGSDEAVPIIKTNMLVDPDYMTRALARAALVKLRVSEKLFPARADYAYGNEIKAHFSDSERNMSGESFEIAGSEAFRKKLITFLDTYTALDTSALTTEKIEIYPGEKGSTYNADTGVITIRFFPGITLGTLISHFMHEAAVINLGGTEHFGPANTTSYAHDLAVLTETAYATVTCTSRGYLWAQALTTDSLWTLYILEKWIARLSLKRNGGAVEPFKVRDVTVFKPGVLTGADNFHVQIEVGKNLVLKSFSITAVK